MNGNTHPWKITTIGREWIWSAYMEELNLSFFDWRIALLDKPLARKREWFSSGIRGELRNDGYTKGGEQVFMTTTRSTNTMSIGFTDAVWHAVGSAMMPRYAVIYDVNSEMVLAHTTLPHAVAMPGDTFTILSTQAFLLN
jgi:hypothetical protein